MRLLFRSVFVVVFVLTLESCGARNEASVQAVDASTLEHGRIVWEGTCKLCHLGGIAGAPKIGDKKVWRSRIDQGLTVLIHHALQGFSGKTGTMPPRGGNALNDKDVAAAVMYMVSKSQ